MELEALELTTMVAKLGARDSVVQIQHLAMRRGVNGGGEEGREDVSLS